MNNSLKVFALPSPLTGYGRCGWGNGYIIIPEGHPLHGMNYNDIEDKYGLAVHGGLTYSDRAGNLRGEPDFINPTDWVIGFDTAHYGDSMERWPNEDSILKHAQEVANQISFIQV